MTSYQMTSRERDEALSQIYGDDRGDRGRSNRAQSVPRANLGRSVEPSPLEIMEWIPFPEFWTSSTNMAVRPFAKYEKK